MTELCDSKRITAVLGKPKCRSIEAMRDHDGNLTHEKEDIAEIFATFYEDLYASRNRHHGAATYSRDCTQTIAPFTREELHACLKQMSLGKAADSLGITAEMLKVDCELL